MGNEEVWVYFLSSKSYGHVATGWEHGVWAFPDSEVGGMESRVKAMRPGCPCIFSVSRDGSVAGRDEYFLCGPGVITEEPSDEIAGAIAGDFFPDGGRWRYGFYFDRLSPRNLMARLGVSEIGSLQIVREGRQNPSQDLHLAGRCVALPVPLPWADAEFILRTTGATDEAFEIWRESKSMPRPYRSSLASGLAEIKREETFRRRRAATK